MRILLFALILLILISDIAYASKIVEVEIEGEINEGTYITISHAFDLASKSGCDAILVVLNTPGGLFTATQKIVSKILNSEIPVIVYVPKGSLSASAGSIILISANVAGVANGTAIGAATPIMPGYVSQKAENKTVNYIAGYVKDIARARGRNPDVVEKFVTEGLTLTADKAYELGIVDVLADSKEELFQKLDGRVVGVDKRTVVLDFSSYEIIKADKPIQAKVYEYISNPQLAAILLLLGIYLLIFGLTSPGVLPETLGAICLVLALAGIGVIELNYLGLILLVLGVIFLIAELLTPTYGVLGTASVICVVLGLLMLFKEPLMPQSFYDTFPKLVAGVGLGMAAVMTFIITRVAKLRRKRSMVGEVVGFEGEVIEFDAEKGRGFAKIRGEIWSIESDEVLDKGDKIVVVERDGLKLKVKKR